MVAGTAAIGRQRLTTSLDQDMSFQCILSTELLITSLAREGFDAEMDSLVPFQVMVSVEGLWAFITLVWPFG
jgi:hypothetical protein